MSKDGLRTIKIRISEDTYQSLNSQLKRRMDLRKSFGVETVEDMLSLFLDSDCNDPNELFDCAEDDMPMHRYAAKAWFRYIGRMRSYRDIAQGKVDSDPSYVKDLEHFIYDYEEEFGSELPDPYDDGQLKFFKGWFNAMEWVLPDRIKPLKNSYDANQKKENQTS